MSDKLLEELLQTLETVKENSSIQKQILEEAKKTTNVYSQILIELKQQNKLLEQVVNSGRVVMVSQ